MSPVRGSHLSSVAENGCAGRLCSRAFAEVGSGVNAIASSAKNSRKESRTPLSVAVCAKDRSVSTSA